MKIDLNKFLICDVPEKTIYSKQFGFFTISCYTKEISIKYHSKDIVSGNINGYSYGNSITSGTFSIDDIYVATEKDVIQNGRKVKDYSYKKFSFNRTIKQGEHIVVKIGSGYHKIYEGLDSGHVKLSSSVNSALRLKLLSDIPRTTNKGTYYNISCDKLKNILETFEWTEETENQLIYTTNINTLKPKTKVFIDTKEGGEGEIVGLKEFNSIEQTAIYEVQLYDGTHIDVNWYDQTVKMLVPKSYEAPNELDVLEETLFENKLNPFVRGISNGFNIYWQAVEEAASYTVELYTWNDASAADKLYKIADKTIERNQYYAVFDLLAEGKYFVRIIAEDRTGLKIAVNKAISVDVKKDTSTAVNNNRRGF